MAKDTQKGSQPPSANWLGQPSTQTAQGSSPTVTTTYDTPAANTATSPTATSTSTPAPTQPNIPTPLAGANAALDSFMPTWNGMSPKDRATFFDQATVTDSNGTTSPAPLPAWAQSLGAIFGTGPGNAPNQAATQFHGMSSTGNAMPGYLHNAPAYAATPNMSMASPNYNPMAEVAPTPTPGAQTKPMPNMWQPPESAPYNDAILPQYQGWEGALPGRGDIIGAIQGGGQLPASWGDPNMQSPWLTTPNYAPPGSVPAYQHGSAGPSYATNSLGPTPNQIP
jgi:hypothetical protein